MNFERSGVASGPLILLAGILSVYVYFFSFLDSDYSPYYGDEYFYYKNSESFYLSNNLKAAFTYSGEGARIKGADAHGPAYPLLYGSMSKLFGWGGMTIPLVNFGILLLAVSALLSSKKMPWHIRTLQSIVILGNPITLFYSISYLPELLQIAGAIGLYLVVKRYISTTNRTDLYILIAYILLLGSIRSTWFFAFFGLAILPGPLGGFIKSGYLLLGLILPFLYQYFLHEQVPNTFSGLGMMVEKQGLLAAADAVYFNFKRNIYFGLTYTEGYFYTLQKLWIGCTLLISMIFFRKDKLIAFGLIVLVSAMMFTILLYKNYNWTELRMYTSIALFLNLSMGSNPKMRNAAVGLVSLNILSFVLILPLQNKLVFFRTQPKTLAIPENTLLEIQKMEPTLVYIDSTVLNKYRINELPAMSARNQAIRYILPYYSLKMASPSHILKEETTQLTIKSVNILSQ